MLVAVAMWPLSLPFAADRKEWEEESHVVLGMRKVLHMLGQASEKLRKESLRLQGQEKEVCLQQSQDQSPQVCSHQRKVRPEAGKRVPWDKDTLHHCKVLQGHLIFRDWWGQRTLDR
jgi:hypothetical protein